MEEGAAIFEALCTRHLRHDRRCIDSWSQFITKNANAKGAESHGTHFLQKAPDGPSTKMHFYESLQMTALSLFAD